MITVELNQITLNLILNEVLFRICSFHKFWTENCHKKSRTFENFTIKYKFQHLITIFFTGQFFQNLIHYNNCKFIPGNLILYHNHSPEGLFMVILLNTIKY